MRSIFIVIYVFLFLLLGLPVLGLMWIIGKFNKPWADMAQLRIVQWAFRCIIFMSGSKLDIRGEENIPKEFSAMSLIYISSDALSISYIWIMPRPDIAFGQF